MWQGLVTMNTCRKIYCRAHFLFFVFREDKLSKISTFRVCSPYWTRGKALGWQMCLRLHSDYCSGRRHLCSSDLTKSVYMWWPVGSDQSGSLYKQTILLGIYTVLPIPCISVNFLHFPLVNICQQQTWVSNQRCRTFDRRGFCRHKCSALSDLPPISSSQSQLLFLRWTW